MQVLMLRPDQLVPDPDQPRKTFNEEKMEELAQSMGKDGIGLASPIIARPALKGKYMIICGERRWRAAKKEGLETVPVIVRRADDETTRLLQLAEDFQKEGVSPYEQGKALLAFEGKYSQRELGRKLGISESRISQLLALAKELDEDEAEALAFEHRGSGVQREAKASPGLATRMTSVRLPRETRDKVRDVVDKEAIPVSRIKQSTLSKIREEPGRAEELLKEEALGITTEPTPKVPTSDELNEHFGLPLCDFEPIKEIVLKMARVAQLCGMVNLWVIRSPLALTLLHREAILLQEALPEAIEFLKAKARGEEPQREAIDIEVEDES